MPNENFPKPLLAKDWARSIGTKKAKPSKQKFELELGRIPLSKDLLTNLKVNKDKSGLSLISRTAKPGVHQFPPSIKTVTLNRSILRSQKFIAETNGLFAEHLGRKQFPALLSKELIVKKRFTHTVKDKLAKGYTWPTTVFSPDERFTFSDTSFPWSTCGRVETAGGGWGSGVMIGPRHFMTASHVINWGPNNTAGWVKFTPLKFDNSEPFGSGFATVIYSWVKADGSDRLNLTEGAFDYVVCVLDRPLGNSTGWMGSRAYQSSWQGGNYWGHIGYPRDLNSGTRPAFIGYQSFISKEDASAVGRTSMRIRHKIDIVPGDSGGPFFGWWANEPWPRVVAVQSGERSDWNSAGGGDPLPELINFARNANP